MSDIKQVKYDIERCICHVPDACRDCSHYTGTVGFGCVEDLLADVLALLKEQEEKMEHLNNITLEYEKEVFRLQAMLKEQEDQIKNRDESLEKAREEIKWLRGMLKEQEEVKPECQIIFDVPYYFCGSCKTMLNMYAVKAKYCSNCGRRVKWG